MDREQRALLDKAVTVSQEAAEARDRADALSAARRDAVKACMDAGIPRQEIADALGVNRVTVYQIAK